MEPKNQISRSLQPCTIYLVQRNLNEDKVELNTQVIDYAAEVCRVDVHQMFENKLMLK